MILTPWPQYRTIPPARIAEVMAGRTLVDPYGVIKADAAKSAGFEYHTLGRSAQGSLPS
jgi:UDPglucose 6-dehydrogenase